MADEGYLVIVVDGPQKQLELLSEIVSQHRDAFGSPAFVNCANEHLALRDVELQEAFEFEKVPAIGLKAMD